MKIHSSEVVNCESMKEMDNEFTRLSIRSSSATNTTMMMMMEGNIFAQDNDGDTCLHLVIIRGDENLCDDIVSAAPSLDWLNLPNRLYQTPLHLAVLTRQPRLVRRLLRAGVSRDCRDMQGNTPLHTACSREGYQDVAEELLHRGNDDPARKASPWPEVNMRNYDGHTCLHLAAATSNLNVMDLLLQHGADINAGDMKSGRTVLHFAVESGNVVLTNYLMRQRRLDINKTTYCGKTALSLAAGRGFVQIVHILLCHGAVRSKLYSDSEPEGSDMET